MRRACAAAGTGLALSRTGGSLGHANSGSNDLGPPLEPTLKPFVLLRHGESIWNRDHRFTGWTDVPLTARGELQAQLAGELLIAEGFRPDVCFTSALRRGIDTLRITLAAMGLSAVPIVESWYLNERHFGALQGLRRLEAVWRFGPRQVWACQHRFAAPPPLLAANDPRHPSRDVRYTDLVATALPSAESLCDTVERIRPFWAETLAPELRRGRSVLVVAHKNSLRALMRLLDVVKDEDVPRLGIRTGRPISLSLDDQLCVLRHRYLDGPAARLRPGSLADPAASLRDA